MMRETAKSQLVDAYDGRAVKYFIIDGTESTYATSIHRGRLFCSCRGFSVWKRCKHAERLMKMFELDDILSGCKIKEVRSSLNAMNELFGVCPYNSDEIFVIYSKPNVGKTLLMVQESFWFMHNGLNVLYVDTEGGIYQFVKKWAQVFSARFEKKGKMYIESRKGIESLFEFLGYRAGIVFRSADSKKEKGKLEFRIVETIDEDIKRKEKIKTIDDVIKEKNIDVVIIDSVTMPIREFTLEQQSHPAKDSALSIMMLKLARIMEENNVIVITTAHASDNPANPYERGAEVRGGRALKHIGKRIVYMDAREKKGLENYRRFWLVRAEDVEKWSKATAAKITDLGYIDIDEREYSEVFTKAEIDRMNEYD